MTWPPPLGSLGAVIAILVIVLGVVFMAIGLMDFKVGGLLVALGVARLT
jgi:hypothetical protein